MKNLIVLFLIFMSSVAWSNAKVVGNGADRCEKLAHAYNCVVSTDMGPQQWTVAFNPTTPYSVKAADFELSLCPGPDDNTKSIALYAYIVISPVSSSISAGSQIKVDLDARNFEFLGSFFDSKTITNIKYWVSCQRL